jgi:hypothetical protein
VTFFTRPRIVLAALAVLLFLVVGVITFTHVGSGSSGSCKVSAPQPSLPAQLRAIGGFDQAFNPSDMATLRRIAASAASAVAPDLIGVQPDLPVAESAALVDRPDALVVPLIGTGAPPQRGKVVGLVAFLRDCAGRAYYSAVDDLVVHGIASAQSFPSVSRAAAAQRLGAASPQLVYIDDPFMPDWRNGTTGASIPAVSQQ